MVVQKKGIVIPTERTKWPNGGICYEMPPKQHLSTKAEDSSTSPYSPQEYSKWHLSAFLHSSFTSFRTSPSTSSRHVLTAQLFVQIPPSCVYVFDKRSFLFPSPFLYLLFSSNCPSYIVSFFVINQLVNIISLRESIHHFMFMIINPAGQIIRHADVKNTWIAREYVNIICLFVCRVTVPVLLRRRGLCRSDWRNKVTERRNLRWSTTKATFEHHDRRFLDSLRSLGLTLSCQFRIHNLLRFPHKATY